MDRDVSSGGRGIGIGPVAMGGASSPANAPTSAVVVHNPAMPQRTIPAMACERKLSARGERGRGLE